MIFGFSKSTKLNFPKYEEEDPIERFNKVGQFFEYQDTHEDHKVSLASFHLDREVNQWWQWLCHAYKEEGKEATWARFAQG